jgi:lipopolysaccharide transport system permease protein
MKKSENVMMLSPYKILLPIVIHSIILSASMVLAAELRTGIAIETTLQADYNKHSSLLHGLLILVTLVTQLSALWLHYSSEKWRHIIFRQFRLILFEVALCSLLTVLLLSTAYALQLVYFALLVMLPAILVIVITGKSGISLFAHETLLHWLIRLYQSRFLLLIWMQYRIQDRYAQTFLGILWIILVPLSQAALFSFVFGTLLGIGSFDVPFVAFFFAGLTIFTIFQSVVNKSVSALITQKGLITKVYFPREITVLLLSAEVVIDFGFTFIALLGVNALYGIYPNVYYIFLPIPIVLMLSFATGTGLLISWFSLAVRDLQQIMSIIIQFLFYLTVLFAGTRVPEQYRFIEKLNPLSAIVEAFRDIMVYEQQPDFIALVYPAMLALAVLYGGYGFFKANEERIVDLL